MSNNPFSDNPYSAPAPGQPPGQPPKAPMGPKPKNYLVLAILCLVCCGGLIAIPAIVFATQVDSKYNSGDFQGAQDASNKAKMWCIISICVGVICNLAIVGIQIAALAAEGGF